MAGEQPSQVVTTSIPQSPLSGSDIAQPYQNFARAMEDASQGLEKVAIPLAENAAADQLSRQKVTRNADGSVSVENPASTPLIFGAAGEAYQKAVQAGTIAQYDNELSQRFTEMHTE